MTRAISVLRGFRRPLAVFSLVAVVALAGCTPQQADAYNRINDSRTSVGLPGLGFDEAIGNDAQRHAARLAAEGRIFHMALPPGSCMTENVGSGSSIEAVHAMLLQSPGHRAHILDRSATVVGTGVASANGRVFVVQRFVRSSC